MKYNNRNPWWKKFNQQWLPEIVVLGGLFLAIVLLSVPSVVTSTLWETLELLLGWIKNIGKQLLKPTNFIAFLIIIGLVIFFIRRIRYHAFRFAPSERICPACGHKIRRRHRKTLDRLISYLVPVRRYFCSNCKWSGLMIYTKELDK